MLSSLKLLNFRNHSQLHCSFDTVTYIAGNNGIGKTSVLESIYTAMQCKSFKNAQLSQMVQFDTDFFRVEVSIENDYPSQISYVYDGAKQLKVNGKSVTSVADHLLHYPLFIYSPENEGILSLNQLNRRRFLDKVAFLNFPEHFYLLKNYNKLLTAKKSLLKSRSIDSVYLESLNEQLIIISDQIQLHRFDTISGINENIIKTFSLTGNYFESFQLHYQKSLILPEKFSEEIQKKKVLQGAHLDRIKYYLADTEYEKFSSFGQRKSFSLVCLNACLLTVEEKLKGDIIFLLDDFEAGLDIERIGLFKDLFSKYQLIVTGVSNHHFKDVKTINL